MRLYPDPRMTGTPAADLGFVLDADSELQVDDITGALVRRGLTVEEVEALVGGRVPRSTAARDGTGAMK